MLAWAKLLVAIGSLLLLGIASGTVASARGTPAQVNPLVSAKEMAAATDPGLPTTVGTVNGEVITGKALAEAEYFFSRQSNQAMDTKALRTDAWNYIVQQVVEEQTATQAGLCPPISAAKHAAMAMGQSATPQNLKLIQNALALMALKQRFWSNAGVKINNNQAWNAYVTQLVQHSTIVLYAKL